MAAAAEPRSSRPTFRDVARAYLQWLENVRGAKPETLRNHRSTLGEPDVAVKRGSTTTNGHLMRALGLEHKLDRVSHHDARLVESLALRVHLRKLRDVCVHPAIASICDREAGVGHGSGAGALPLGQEGGGHR